MPGNCFYRAVMFGFLEALVLCRSGRNSESLRLRIPPSVDGAMRGSLLSKGYLKLLRFLGLDDAHHPDPSVCHWNLLCSMSVDLAAGTRVE